MLAGLNCETTGQAQQVEGAWVCARLHAVGDCPQLEVLRHAATRATAAHLQQYARLRSLSDLLCAALPATPSLISGLAPLTRLQHLHLTQCALSGHALSKASSAQPHPRRFNPAGTLPGSA